MPAEESLEHQQMETALKQMKELEWHGDDSSSDDEGEKKRLEEYDKRKQRLEITMSRVQNTDMLAYRTYVEKDFKRHSIKLFPKHEMGKKYARAAANTARAKGFEYSQTLTF